MYDNPHHPSTKEFGDYSIGWSSEVFSQNEKNLSIINNEKITLEERLAAYDLLAKSSIQEKDGKRWKKIY
jgi:hypothetical protein